MTELDTRVIIDSETGGINEVQSVKVDGTSGTFTLTLEGETTDAINFNASAATVEAELVALSNVYPDDVSLYYSGSLEQSITLIACHPPHSVALRIVTRATLVSVEG